MAATAAFLVLYLSRRLTFFYDEWDFLLDPRPLTPAVAFQPHNEHWSTLPILAYRGLEAAFGLGSYRPWMALLAVIHGAAGLVLFRLVNRRSGPVLGLFAAGLFLFLGRGFQDLMWAFQIGFDGSVLFGLIALDLFDQPAGGAKWRPAAGMLALVGSLACSGIGLVFCAVAGLEVLLDRERRRYLPWLAVPAAAYLLWFFTYGRQGLTPGQAHLNARAIGALAVYTAYGAGASLAALLGLSGYWAPRLLPLAIPLLVLTWWRRRRVGARPAAALIGLGFQFALTGAVRAQFGYTEAAASRYVYVGSVLVLLVATDALSGLPWRPAVGFALTAVVAAAAVYGYFPLTAYRQNIGAVLQRQLDEQSVLLSLRGAPDLDPDSRVDLFAMPQVFTGPLLLAAARHGPPVPPASDADLGRLDPTRVDPVLVRATARSVRAHPVAGAAGSCLPLAAAGDIHVRGGADLLIQSGGARHVAVYYFHYAGFQGADGTDVALDGSPVQAIHLPDLGRPLEWTVRVIADAGSTVALCP